MSVAGRLKALEGYVIATSGSGRTADSRQQSGPDPGSARPDPPSQSAPPVNPTTLTEQEEVEIWDLKEWIARYAGLATMQVTHYCDYALRGTAQTAERVLTTLRAAQRLPAQKLKETILAANQPEGGLLKL